MQPTQNLDRAFFIFLLNSNADLFGSEMTKGQLERIGADIAEKMLKKYGEASLAKDSFQELKESQNPLTAFDTTLEINGDSLFIIDRCPFADIITAYLEIVGEMPQVFSEITKAYNDEGLGFAISPYCIIHQTFRRIIGGKIKIKGSPCEILQLGCKARNGNIKQAPENIRKSGLTDAAVNEKLKASACAYLVKKVQ